MKISEISNLFKRSAVLLLLSTTVACTAVPEGAQFFDPYEETNRKNHEFNKSLDKNVIRPVALTYGTIVPDPIEAGVGNFAGNLGLPGDIVNNLLQGDLRAAGKNSLRFFINTTAGLGGIFDPSTVMGLEAEETDFGQTLAVWGVGEGAYLELPVLGPSTERDVVGILVDVFLDPVSYVIGRPESTYRQTARAGDLLGTRNELGPQIDDVYQNSVDSYEQFKVIYLQNRRFELDRGAGGSENDAYIDPYDDF